MRPIDGDALSDQMNERLRRCNNGSIVEACLLAELDLVNSMPTITPPPNDPLTLDELREMDGEPVWCVNGLGTQRWCLVNCDDEILCCYDSETGLWDGCFYEMTGDGEQGLHPMGWLAYRRKPEENKR